MGFARTLSCSPAQLKKLPSVDQRQLHLLITEEGQEILPGAHVFHLIKTDIQSWVHALPDPLHLLLASAAATTITLAVRVEDERFAAFLLINAPTVPMFHFATCMSTEALLDRDWNGQKKERNSAMENTSKTAPGYRC